MTRPSALSIADLDTLIAALDGDDGLARVRAIAHLTVDDMPIQLARDLHAALRHSATVRAAAIAECVAEAETWASFIAQTGTSPIDTAASVKRAASQAFRDHATKLRSLSPHSPDAKAALVERWQPIATAPKDGTVVLVCRFGSDHYWVMSDHWSIDAECWVDSDEPTHWAPLPAPPAKVPE